MASYRLIGTPRSRAMRVIVLLEELGLDYTVEALPLASDAVRAIHSEGKVPILETPEGDKLTDSFAIMSFLADRHGDPARGPIFPAGTPERALQDGHAAFLIDEWDAALWTISQHSYVWPEPLRALEAVRPAAEHGVRRAHDRLAARLGDRSFLMGERFTLPDIIAGHCGGWSKIAGLPVEQPAVLAYLDRVYARPANKRAREKAAAALKAAGMR